MALDLQPPSVPHLDDYGVLDLDLLAGQPLLTSIQLTPVAQNMYLHALWSGTTREGVAIDTRPPPRLIIFPDEVVPIDVAYQNLQLLDQGHVVYSYTLQPSAVFAHDYEESRRATILVGNRHFPGAGLNVASIKESHSLQFDASDLPSVGATVAVAPWQAMHTGDKVTLTWSAFRQNGQPIGDLVSVHEVAEADVGLPVSFQIPRANISLARNGRGVLSYMLDYVGGGHSAAPSQSFTIEPALVDRCPPLQILEHSGGPIDPGLMADGMTFGISAYSQLHEGDSLIVSAQDVATGVVDFITSIRLDRSSVDSGLLQAHIEGDWLMDYLDRELSLGYQVARPGTGLAGTPLVLPVRATMVLPMPVVEGAGAVDQGEGEFKAIASADGIRVRVPSTAVYPADAQVQLHWEGFPGPGSHVATVSEGTNPLTYVIPTTVIAPNLGKKVKVFYRVTLAGEAPRDSEVFTLRIVPIPSHAYPTLNCVEAVNGELRVASLPTQGSNQTVAPWPLIAVGQVINLSATGRLRSGIVETNEFVKDRQVTNASSGVSGYLSKAWLSTVAPNTELEFTASVTADGGETKIVFPRVYVKVI